MAYCIFELREKPIYAFLKPSIYFLRYKGLDKKRANSEFAAKRDLKDYKILKYNFFL